MNNNNGYDYLKQKSFLESGATATPAAVGLPMNMLYQRKYGEPKIRVCGLGL